MSVLAPSFLVHDAIFGTVSPINLRQLISGGWRNQTNVLTARASDRLDPQEFYGGAAEPICAIETADLFTVLTNFSPTAGLVLGVPTPENVTLPFKQRNQDGGTFITAGGVGTSVGKSLTIVESLSADMSREGPDQPGATANLEVHPWSADGTNPVSIAVNQTLAAVGFIGQYAMGPVALNGTAVDGVTGFRVRPGLRLLKKRGVNEELEMTYPCGISIVERAPVIEIDFEDFYALFSLGHYSAMTSCSVFFRKRTDGGRFVSDATAAHGRATFGAGIANVEAFQAASGDGKVTLMLHGKALSWSPAVAIA